MLHFPTDVKAGEILNILFGILNSENPLDNLSMLNYYLEQISKKREEVLELNRIGNTKYILEKDVWGNSEIFLIIKDHNGVHLILSHLSKSNNDFATIREYVMKHSWFSKVEDYYTHDTFMMNPPSPLFPKVQDVHMVFRKGMGLADGFDISLLINFKKSYLPDADESCLKAIDKFNTLWEDFYKAKKITTVKNYFIDLSRKEIKKELKTITKYEGNNIIYYEKPDEKYQLSQIERFVIQDGRCLCSLYIDEILQYAEYKEYTYNEANLLLHTITEFIPLDHGTSEKFVSRKIRYNAVNKIVKDEYFVNQSHCNKFIHYEYDSSGNTISKKTFDDTWCDSFVIEKFKYYHDNRIREIIYLEDENEQPKKIERFEYDDSKFLILKKVFQYNQEYLFIQHHNENGMIKKEEEYQNGKLRRYYDYKYSNDKLIRKDNIFISGGLLNYTENVYDS